MTNPDFVYVTYIETTPEKLWAALTEPELTKAYWPGHGPNSAHVNVSDWKPGSRWEHQQTNDGKTVDIVGKVIEASPPHRLVLSWARPKEEGDETKHSRATFDLEQQGAVVRLTVTHDGLDPQMLAGISGGWPMVLSNLKTFLEHGRALPKSEWM